MSFRIRMFAALFALFLLAGCGGGGGDAGGAAPSAVQSDPIAVTQMHLAAPVNGATNYLLYLPAGYGADSAKKWPLLVFLHGSQSFTNLMLSSLSQQGVMGYMKQAGKGLPQGSRTVMS